MASPLKPTFYQTPSLRTFCHHCCRRFLPTLSHKRLLTTQGRTRSEYFTRELLDDLDKINKPRSQSDFVKSASATLGLATAKLGLGLRKPGLYPPVGKLSQLADQNLEPPPHHLHVFSTKHNCHITLTDGNRQPLISVSSGNIGFRKAARGSYDAAFQLGAYVMERIQKQGIIKTIHAVELILRDFGPGREAFTKILMGNDGRILRDRVVRVMDATKLKFGGTRSKKPRRL